MMFKLTETDFQQMREEYGGFCVCCGEASYGVEPDARGYQCESCGRCGVFGVEELLFSGHVQITDDGDQSS